MSKSVNGGCSEQVGRGGGVGERGGEEEWEEVEGKKENTEGQGKCANKSNYNRAINKSLKRAY